MLFPGELGQRYSDRACDLECLDGGSQDRKRDDRAGAENDMEVKTFMVNAASENRSWLEIRHEFG